MTKFRTSWPARNCRAGRWNEVEQGWNRAPNSQKLLPYGGASIRLLRPLSALILFVSLLLSQLTTRRRLLGLGLHRMYALRLPVMNFPLVLVLLLVFLLSSMPSFFLCRFLSANAHWRHSLLSVSIFRLSLPSLFYSFF
jgi:hypothetical protein